MDKGSGRKPAGRHAGLENEILQEIAEALGNSGERVERALDRLHASGGRIDVLRARLGRCADSVRKAQLREQIEEEVARYSELRRKALEAFRDLTIHREAVGFRNHKLVLEKYPIPPPISFPDE